MRWRANEGNVADRNSVQRVLDKQDVWIVNPTNQNPSTKLLFTNRK